MTLYLGRGFWRFSAVFFKSCSFAVPLSVDVTRKGSTAILLLYPRNPIPAQSMDASGNFGTTPLPP